MFWIVPFPAVPFSKATPATSVHPAGVAQLGTLVELTVHPLRRPALEGVPVPVKVASPLIAPEVAVMLLAEPQAVDETTVARPVGLMVTQLIVVDAQVTAPVISAPDWSAAVNC